MGHSEEFSCGGAVRDAVQEMTLEEWLEQRAGECRCWWDVREDNEWERGRLPRCTSAGVIERDVV